MKKILISIISLMLLGTGVSIDTLTNNSSKYKKLSDDVSIVEEKVGKKSNIKGTEKKKQDEKSTQIVEKSEKENKKENVEPSNHNVNSSNTTESNNSTNTNDKASTSNNKEKSSPNIPTNNYVPPVPVQTEWEKLGISEYDYYNSPGENEGEIAFSDAVSVCDGVGANISDKYGLVTHSGDVKSYSENYIGCWITIHLADGSWMFYNEFKVREARGEFKVREGYQ